MPLTLYSDAEKGALDLVGKPAEIHVIPIQPFKTDGSLKIVKAIAPPQKPKVSNYIRFILWFNAYRFVHPIVSTGGRNVADARLGDFSFSC